MRLGEFWGDLGLRLLMIIDKMKNTGAINTPPGMKSIIIPIMVGIHQALPLELVWACSFLLSGIKVLEWGFG
jgi:hypothetical protein